MEQQQQRAPLTARRRPAHDRVRWVWSGAGPSRLAGSRWRRGP